jgi:cellulose synthase (UDP-forming)
MGVQRAAEFSGPHSYYSVHFVLAHTQLPRAASLNITYRFDSQLAAHSAPFR